MATLRAPQLILWRHAEAEEMAQSTVTRWTPAKRAQDHERALTSRGRAQARRMAKWLHARLPDKMRVLVSPARRCIETAQALTKDFEQLPELGPEHDSADLLRAIGWPDLPGTLILIGHQPTLGRVAAMMMTGREADWSLKKGSVWWFARRLRGDHTQHVLRAVMAPDMAKD